MMKNTRLKPSFVSVLEDGRGSQAVEWCIIAGCVGLLTAGAMAASSRTTGGVLTTIGETIEAVLSGGSGALAREDNGLPCGHPGSYCAPQDHTTPSDNTKLNEGGPGFWDRVREANEDVAHRLTWRDVHNDARQQLTDFLENRTVGLPFPEFALGSNAVKNIVKEAMAAGWRVEYTDGPARTDTEGRVIYLNPDDQERVWSDFAHELGHVRLELCVAEIACRNGLPEELQVLLGLSYPGSRRDDIDPELGQEVTAFMFNAIIRDEILTDSGHDIGMSADQNTAHRYAQLLRGEHGDIQLAKGIWWRAGDADRRDMTRWQDLAIQRAADLIRDFETAGDGTSYGTDDAGEEHVADSPQPGQPSAVPEGQAADPGETWADASLPAFRQETQDVIESAGDHIAAVGVHSEGQLDTQTVGRALQGLEETIDLIVDHNAHLPEEEVVDLLSPYHGSAQRGRMLIERASDAAADGDLSSAAQLLWDAKEELERLRAG